MALNDATSASLASDLPSSSFTLVDGSSDNARKNDLPTGTAVMLHAEATPQQLCDHCRALDLTVDKFVIGNGSATSAPGERGALQLYNSKKLNTAKFRLKSGSTTEFAKLHELYETRDSCSFCDLLCNAIERYSQETPKPDTMCLLSWEVDGRQIKSVEGRTTYMNNTRRIRLSWMDQSTEREVYLVLVAPSDPSMPNSDARSKWKRDSLFLGRDFDEQKGNQALIKSWLDLCLKDHDEFCLNTHGTEKEFLKLVGETYFGVIDVVDMQLKSLPVKKGKPARFVALSYVWGRPLDEGPPYITTRANVMTHILHGGLESTWGKLPKTIRDAILLVSRLGERFLWIDSLCIVQDSETSWRLNAQAMHLIYGNAYFTICAADGDSSIGLRAASTIIKHATQSRQNMDGESSINLTVSSLNTKSSEELRKSRLMSIDYADGVRIMLARPLEAVINDSVWNKRAWTFQERILSRRCLIFSEGSVYFQCRSTSISQDIHADGRGRGWSLDRTDSPLKTLTELERRPLWFYMKYVSLYTGRNLTKPQDILAAFDGISWMLKRHLVMPFIFGMPTSHFDLALLWTPLGAVHRRHSETSPNEDCTQDADGNYTCTPKNDDPLHSLFPSWAWSGWMGGTVEYRSSMLEGVFLNIGEWLKHHTWIQWYIRDERGHLRPLWELICNSLLKDLPESDDKPWSFKSEYRWKGYPGNGKFLDKLDTPVRRRSSYRSARTIQERRVRKVSKRTESSSEDEVRLIVERVDNTHYISRKSGHGILNNQRARRREPSPDPNLAYGEKYQSSDSESEKEKNKKSPKDVIEVVEYESDTLGNGSEKSNSSSSSYDATSTETSTVDSDLVGSDVDLSPRVRKNRDGGPIRSSRKRKDPYGRLLPKDIPKKNPPFQAILPENPFGVIREENIFEQHIPQSYRPILQFWTWRTEFYVAIRSSPLQKSPGPGLCQCDIADKEGDWCGSIVLNESWIKERQGAIFQFIAIADAKAFTEEECPTWNYYIPQQRNQSEWNLYYVLLLERNDERGLWERIGLGKTFQAAFKDKIWSEIKLG